MCHKWQGNEENSTARHKEDESQMIVFVKKLQKKNINNNAEISIISILLIIKKLMRMWKK